MWPDFSTALRSARNDKSECAALRMTGFKNSSGRLIIFDGQIPPLRGAEHRSGRDDNFIGDRV